MSAIAPVVVSGVRSNATTSAQSIKVRDVEPQINLLQPYFYPLQYFAASKFFGEKATGGEKSKTEWNEDKYLPDSVTVPAGITGGGTTETFAVSNDYFQTYDKILVESSGEVLLVTAASTPNVTVKKVGAGNITAAVANSTIMRIGNAFPEDGSKQEALTTLTVGKSCYCQILKKAVKMTGREQAADTYGEGWKYQWVKASLEVKEEMERSWCLNGASYLDTVLEITYSAGLRGALTTNTITYPGNLDEIEFDDAINQIMAYGTGENSGMLCVMVGSLIESDMNKWMKNRYAIMQDSKELEVKTYGLATTMKNMSPQFIDYKHPNAILRVFWNPQLKGSKWGTCAAIFDPRMLTRMYMKPDEDGPRKYRQEMAIKTPGADRKEGQMLFDQGLKVRLEETGGWLQKAGL